MALEDIGAPRLDNALRNFQYQNSFSPQENTMLDNMKKYVRLHNDLIKLGKESGKKKFDTLDNDIKDALVTLYGSETEYMLEPKSFFGTALDAVKSAVTSPFRAAFGAINAYTQGLNAIENQAMQAMENGVSFFDKDAWANSLFEGESLYNTELDAKLTKKYGKAKAFIAKGLLAGRKPGEIIQSWGQLDDEFLYAMQSALNEPEKWDGEILEDYRQAKLSWGRYVGRVFLGSRDGNDYLEDGFIYDVLHGIGFDKVTMSRETRDKFFTAISGQQDLVQTILTDPLTYVTGGANQGLRFAGKAITKQAKVNDLARAGNVNALFKDKSVIKFWDDYGAELDNLTRARYLNNDPAEAARIVEDIQLRFARHGSREEIELFRGNISNAKDAEAFFSQAENFTRLMSGRTSDASYYLESVAIAKRTREAGLIFRKAWSRLGSSKTKEDLASIQDDVISEIKQLSELEPTSKVQTPVLFRLREQNKNWRNSVANALAKHPSDESIIVNENAAETLDTVKNIARILVPDDMAGVVAERFLAANMDERVVMLRGMYRGVMETMGLDKTVGGRQVIDTILNEKFGRIGMTITPDLGAPAAWSVGDSTPKVIDGAIYDYQATGTIGNLNWEQIRVAVADAALETGGKSAGSKFTPVAFIGGAMNSRYATWLTNKWTLLTLAPKLGVRSAIDEAFFFMLSAPSQVILNALSGKGKSAGRVATRYTGSKAAVGFFGGGFQKVLGKMFPKAGLNPAEEFLLADRQQIMKNAIDIAEKEDMPREAAMHIFRKMLATDSTANSRLLNDVEKQHMIDLLISNPDSISSGFSSLARRTGTNATIDDAVKVHLDEPTLLTRAQEEFNVVLGQNFKLVDPAQLTQEQTKFLMFHEFYKKFYKNKLGTADENIDISKMFISRNALQTQADYELFVKDIADFIASKPNQLGRFLNQRSGAYKLREQGLSDYQIVKYYADLIARDMYITFHGSASSFNDNLLNTIRSGGVDKWEKELLSFEEYSKAVDGFARTKPFATNVEQMTGINDEIASWVAKVNPDKVWDLMDRTQNAMIRQPVVTSYYLYYRKKYMKLEQQYKKEVYTDLSKYVKDLDQAADQAELIAAKRFSEIAIKSAVNHTLKYVDNPHVRSTIVSSMRNVNRFARATEDFWRRMYRLRDNSAQAIYRLRLIHSGLNGVGSIETDDQGEQYFLLPMDNIIYEALDPVLRTFGGDASGFKQPMFNNYTVKLSAMNPSFQDQAGIPFFSGPIAGVSILTLQSIMSNFGGENTVKLADEMDNFLLGDLGDNLTLRKAITPALVERVWTALDTNEKSKANATAILSAMAYNQANGNGAPTPPPADASPEEVARYNKERNDYLNSIRISGHNLVFLRSVLGTILPFSVGTQDDVDVPDYIRDTGITNIRGEYFDILDSVIKNYGTEVSDPYEVAAALYIGKNPNKLVYTVSREDKKLKPLLRRTEEVKDWIMSNGSFIDEYGDAAYLFAPTNGEINSTVYRWMQAAELVDTLPIEDFLNSLQIAVDKQYYFDISDWEDSELAKTSYYEDRKLIIDQATRMREALKNKNPLLVDALMPDGAFDVEYEKNMLQNLKAIIADPNSPISKESRNRVQTALSIFDRGYTYVTNDSLKNVQGYTQLKAGMADKVMEELESISLSDPLVRQVVTMVFKPLIKFNSRAVSSANAVDYAFDIGTREMNM